MTSRRPGPAPIRALDDLPPQVIEPLNDVLRLEYLSYHFYRNGLDAAGLIPDGDRPVFEQILAHETAHAARVAGILGTNAIDKPGIDYTAGGAYPDVFTSYATYLALAQLFEDLAVRGVLGALPQLFADGPVLANAVQILSVESRHAAEVRRLRGKKAWITGASGDLPGFAALYAGEDNTLQGGVSAGSGAAATESFDEPLGHDAVLAIVGPFIS